MERREELVGVTRLKEWCFRNITVFSIEAGLPNCFFLEGFILDSCSDKSEL